MIPSLLFHVSVGFGYTPETLRQLTTSLAPFQRATSDRFFYLGPAAKEELNNGNILKAKQHATELMTMTPKYVENWNYGNAIQDFNLVLGRIALKHGNAAKAKEFLIAQSQSSGSPQMDKIGPNVSLAKDLLEKGETQVVIDYLLSCKAFWRTDNGKLDEWIATVQSGRIPDFGTNLLY